MSIPTNANRGQVHSLAFSSLGLSRSEEEFIKAIQGSNHGPRAQHSHLVDIVDAVEKRLLPDEMTLSLSLLVENCVRFQTLLLRKHASALKETWNGADAMDSPSLALYKWYAH